MGPGAQPRTMVAISDQPASLTRLSQVCAKSEHRERAQNLFGSSCSGPRRGREAEGRVGDSETTPQDRGKYSPGTIVLLMAHPVQALLPNLDSPDHMNT
jgi:hypothetical protein